MQSTHIALAVAFLSAVIYSQCTGNDHPTCVSWIANGFCTSASYTLERRKNYCGVQCGLCNIDGSQTALGGGPSLTSCSDLNTNCAAWASTGFCTNPVYSNAIRLLYCCNTCRPFLTTTIEYVM
ncbi:hypothetical protein PENTCL1PPCAC_15729, partial [Pristionchus entomophagus]